MRALFAALDIPRTPLLGFLLLVACGVALARLRGLAARPSPAERLALASATLVGLFVRLLCEAPATLFAANPLSAPMGLLTDALPALVGGYPASRVVPFALVLGCSVATIPMAWLATRAWAGARAAIAVLIAVAALPVLLPASAFDPGFVPCLLLLAAAIALAGLAVRRSDPWLLVPAALVAIVALAFEPVTAVVAVASDRLGPALPSGDGLFFATALDRPFLFEAVLVAAALLLAVRGRTLVRLGRAVPSREWLVVGLLTLLAAVLRCVGGSRIPGYVNGHGYEVLAGLFQGAQHDYGPNGAGMFALHGLMQTFLPRNEAAVLAVHCTLSTLTVPLTWAVARLWVGARPAPWAAAVAALLSGPAFYAMTEFHVVPGTFFLLLALVVAGLACRDVDPVLMAATALLTALAAQFHPTLLACPALVALFVLVRPGALRLLRNPWTWLAVGLLVALSVEPIAFLLARASRGELQQDLWPGLATVVRLLLRVQGTAGRAGNTILNLAYTPFVVPLLVAIGVFAAARSARGAGLALLVAILVLGTPGIFYQRMSAVRTQLLAVPFYAILAGLGASRALGWVPGRPPWPRLAAWTAAGLLGASFLAWPGVRGATFSPQDEHRLAVETVPRIPAGCVVLYPSPGPTMFMRIEVPTHLVDGDGGPIAWVGVDPAVPTFAPQGSCRYYFRPFACWDVRAEPASGLAVVTGMRDSCTDVEASLRLEPFAVWTVPSRPDDTQVTVRDVIDLGFFRVLPP